MLNQMQNAARHLATRVAALIGIVERHEANINEVAETFEANAQAKAEEFEAKAEAVGHRLESLGNALDEFEATLNGIEFSAGPGLEEHTVAELRELCDERGLAHRGLRKQQLIALLS